jgi:glycine oxidase
MTMHILVKGAGVAGLTVAWQLYRHGLRVSVSLWTTKANGWQPQ